MSADDRQDAGRAKAGEASHSVREAAFYGRRKGKPLRAAQAGHLVEALPRLTLTPEQVAAAPLSALFPDAVDCVRLEIGFGGGEHLVSEALRHPGIGYIGAEAFLNGLAKATACVAEQEIRNVRLYGDDVVPLLDRLPDGGLDRVDLLYPDPWPKRRHWKRRFLRPDNIARIARILAPGGRFRFATDIEHYAAWALRLFLADPRFEWTATHADDWHRSWEGWPGTRYEAKALREGRIPGYYEFLRL